MLPLSPHTVRRAAPAAAIILLLACDPGVVGGPAGLAGADSQSYRPCANPEADEVDATCLARVSAATGVERILRYLSPASCPDRPRASDLPLSDGLDPQQRLQEVAQAVERTAVIFAPGDPQRAELLRFALVGAMAKESSFHTRAKWEDRDDATFGLLQIRWSSTVHDFLRHGRASHGQQADQLCDGLFTELAARGAAVDWQRPSAFWARGKNGHQFMQLVGCNVFLGAWYYLASATARGNDLHTHCRAADNQRQELLQVGARQSLEVALASHRAGPTLVKAYLLQDTGAGWYEAASGRMSGHNGATHVNERWLENGCSWGTRFATGCNGNEDPYADKIGHFAFLAARVAGSDRLGAVSRFSLTPRLPGQIYGYPVLAALRQIDLSIPVSCADPPGAGAGPGGFEGYPWCTGAAVDPDGDGWGWENGQSCKVP